MIGTDELEHISRNVASVLTYAFTMPEVSLYVEEAAESGEPHPVYVARKIARMVVEAIERKEGLTILQRDMPGAA